jgi:hypothetical protein
MRKIMAALRIVARDQNKVFVEKSKSRRRAPSDVEAKYQLDIGKAMACVEFDIEEKLLLSQYNRRLRLHEWFIVGNVDLRGRNPMGYFDR